MCVNAECAPALRLYPGRDKAVSYDEIIEALEAWTGYPESRTHPVTKTITGAVVAEFNCIGLASLVCAAIGKEDATDNHSRYRNPI